MKKSMNFDYIVSNPPFKLDFSDWRDNIAASKQSVVEDESAETKKLNKRFFAGVPKIPNKDKDKMAIYLLFLQHMISCLKAKGKAAVVVPTGFLTEGKGKTTSIANKIRMKLVDEKMLRAVVSMPSNIFANTGTNVSILFIDKGNATSNVVLVDASNLGEKVKDGKNQKTLLSREEEQRIIDAVNEQIADNGFSVVKTFDEIKVGKYSFNPGGYFDVEVEWVNLTLEGFNEKMEESQSQLSAMFTESSKLEKLISKIFSEVHYEV
jgi:type I restriction enzyme M protein